MTPYFHFKHEITQKKEESKQNREMQDTVKQKYLNFKNETIRRINIEIIKDYFIKSSNNEIHIVKIENSPFLQIKLDNNLTFLFDINGEKEVLFHRMLHPKWSIIDHINQDDLDCHEYNLHK
ncbi:2903_t:CDS:2, partial [Dentiscutata heterogama]